MGNMLRGMQGSGNMNEMQQQMMNNPELMNQLMSSPHVQNAMQVSHYPFFILKSRVEYLTQTEYGTIIFCGKRQSKIACLGFIGQSRIITTNDKIESSNESDYGTESRNSTHV